MSTTVLVRGPVAHVRGTGNAGRQLILQRVDDRVYVDCKAFCYELPMASLAFALLDIDGATIVVPEVDGSRALRFERIGTAVTVWGYAGFITVNVDDFRRAASRAGV